MTGMTTTLAPTRRGPRASTAARLGQMASLLGAGLTVRQAGERMGLRPRRADYTAEALRQRERQRAASEPTPLPVPSRPLPAPRDWRDAAACRGHDPALFFAPETERRDARRMRLAAAGALCAACPVRAECDGFAGTHGAVGMWAGTDRDGGSAERMRRRRQQNAAWNMRTDLPGFSGRTWQDDSKDALKAKAERVLARFASSLGAIFPDTLRQQVQQARNAYYEAACEHSEMAGHEEQEARAFGRVSAYDDVLAMLAEAGTGSEGSEGHD